MKYIMFSSNLEILENRSLLESSTCEVEAIVSAVCYLGHDIVVDSTNTLSIEGGTFLLKSTPDDLAHFKYQLTGATLKIHATGSASAPIVGVCSSVSGKSGEHGSDEDMAVCNFGRCAGKSGTKTTTASGFRAYVSFPLMTNSRVSDRSIEAIGSAGILSGEVLLSGIAIFEFYVDHDSLLPSMQSTIRLHSWLPVITSEGKGTFSFPPINEITSVGPDGS